jgi:hypothetical protein
MFSHELRFNTTSMRDVIIFGLMPFLFDRPCRDGDVLLPFSRHFVPGYYRNVPVGTEALLRCHLNAEVPSYFRSSLPGRRCPPAVFPALCTGLLSQRPGRDGCALAMLVPIRTALRQARIFRRDQLLALQRCDRVCTIIGCVKGARAMISG